jgi:phasin family protein
MATKKADAARDGVSHPVEGLETVMKNGTEQFRTGFEKAVKNYDQFLGYGKETVNAYVKAANAAGTGAESLHNELYAYSRQSIEDTLAATKAILASKSVHEAFELQTDFAKSAFDAYVGKMSKFSEIMTAATKETLEPIQGRYQAWVEVVQNNRAA